MRLQCIGVDYGTQTARQANKCDGQLVGLIGNGFEILLPLDGQRLAVINLIALAEQRTLTDFAGAFGRPAAVILVRRIAHEGFILVYPHRFRNTGSYQ